MLVRRVAQEGIAATDQDRHVCDGDVDAIEHVLRDGVFVQIQVRERMAVAREEFPDAQRARAVYGTDQHDVTEVAVDERHAAEDERAHEDVAQLRVGLNERHQSIASKLDDLAVLADAQRPHRAPAGNHVRFARELPRMVGGDDHHAAVGRRAHRFHRAIHHDEERHRRVTGRNEHIAARNRAPVSLRGEPGDLRVGECGENAVLFQRHGG